MYPTIKDFLLRVLILLILGGAILFFMTFGHLFLPIIIAFIISLFFVPLLDKLNRYGIGDGVSIFISLFGFIGFISTIFFLVVPIFVRELGRFITVVNSFFISLQQAFATGDLSKIPLPDRMLKIIGELVTPDQINQILQMATDNTSQILGFISGGASNILQASKGVVLSFASTTFLIVTTIILIIFFLSERRSVAYVVRSVFPNTWKHEYDHIVHEAYQIVGKWAKGQAILSLSIFSLTFVVLHLVNVLFDLGLTNIFTLALLAGLLENVPYLGPLLALIPALAIALGISTKATIIVVVVYICIQQIENNLLVPKVMSKTLSISSLLTLLVMIVATGAFGILGTLLAVPFTAVIELLYGRWQFYKNGEEIPVEYQVKSYFERRAYNSLFAKSLRSIKRLAKKISHRS